ncbi:hypothetical protein E9993_09685 [Labilibacter sediminis]|nr:hypothetical protein E9993_09685 [Labilibacter sediminis]
MVRCLRLISMVFFLVGASFPMSVIAQDIEFSSQKGLEYFKAGDYQKAELVYAHLLEKYPKDARYNFYMGICEFKNRTNISGAIKKLNYARIKNVSRDVYYYLGRAHQLSYHFEEAVSNFKKFQQYASSTDKRVEKSEKFIQECKDGAKISSKIYQLSVLDKSISHKDSVLEMYYPAKDVGKLFKNGDFFESGVNPDHVMFETERGDVVYFSMDENDEDTLSIYKMVKLLDGWGDSELVDEPVNSIYNDAYPFLETDGLTFYFSSDRPGGLGGFDIYKVYYDNESQSFLNPINLGVPFNSPDDDFLFVSDEFNKVAWFASNRETNGDNVMVYTIKWDGKQVRNMAEDANQIQESAKLLVQGSENTEGGGRADFTYESERKLKEERGAFVFEINDTLVYREFDHFLSSEALELFKAGFESEQRKDSLASLMSVKRRDFSKTNNSQERNALVNEILKLENQVYSLEDQVQEKYLYARKKELDEIILRMKNGTYQQSRQVKSDKPKPVSIEGIFIPEKYTFHTSDEFERHLSRLEKMYTQLFSENDKQSLRYADSLYVWAGILNLESSRLLEESTKVEEDTNIKLSQLIKKNGVEAEAEEELKSTKMLKESKELKILSTRIYHKALDKKFPLYWLKLKGASSKLGEEKSKQVMELSEQGNAYFREAKRSLSTPGGLSIEGYEKAGAMKRAGIESQEEALYLYRDILNNGASTEGVSERKKAVGVVQKSYSEIHKGEEAAQSVKEVKEVEKEEQPEAVQKQEAESSDEYRIQIGVFRNPPNANALAKIPEVSSVELKGRGLTKYFAGKYNTYEEAAEVVDQIVEAGFPGAFVVYFKDGAVSSIPKNVK